jgi:hypothetical protein
MTLAGSRAADSVPPGATMRSLLPAEVATSSSKPLLRSDKENPVDVNLRAEYQGPQTPWVKLARCRRETSARRRCKRQRS